MVKKCKRRMAGIGFDSKAGVKGSRKNNSTFLAPMHPAWLRCESSEYA
jgi:hypothetical protein